MPLLVLNNDSGSNSRLPFTLPPVASSAITIMTMTALVMTLSGNSDRSESLAPTPLKTPQLHICQGLMGKQTKLSLMSNCITSYLWTLSISSSQNLWNVMDSSKPLISIFPIASSGRGIFPHQDLRFQSDFQFHLASHSHYYANTSFTWRQELSS